MKRNPYLKVKIKSLVEEARIIRHAEREANKNHDYAQQNELRNHRVTIVRRATRESLLAYQYLRGIPYAAVEPHTRADNPINWKEVARMCKKYGEVTLDHEAWTSGICLEKAA